MATAPSTTVDLPPAPTFTLWVRLLGQPVNRWLVYGAGWTDEGKARVMMAGVMEMGNGVIEGRVTSGEIPEG